MKLVDKWLSRQFNGPEEEDEKPWVNDDKPQVIVVGSAGLTAAGGLL